MDNEKTMYEILVKYNSHKFDIKIKITNEKISLEKLKGFFNKKYKIIDTIYNNEINMIKDKPQISFSNDLVILETENKTYKFICKNINESKKLMKEIIKFKKGYNILDNAVADIKNGQKKIVDIVDAVGAIIPAGIVMGGAVIKNRNKVFNAIKKFKKISKK